MLPEGLILKHRRYSPVLSSLVGRLSSEGTQESLGSCFAAAEGMEDDMKRVLFAGVFALFVGTGIWTPSEAAPMGPVLAPVATGVNNAIPVYYYRGHYYRYRHHRHYYNHRYYRYY
jgi:hypothetical protein